MDTDQREADLSFGPFSLSVSERLLTRDGAAIDLGGRALDLLIVLISSPNQVVSKKELMSRVWTDLTVEEGSLRFHINGLRRALGDGQDGARYIVTIPGRGYSFVAPVAMRGAADSNSALLAANFSHGNLPARLNRMVGRDEDILKLSSHLISTRFVTIVGAGGVGKTTVAIATGHHLIEAFGGAVLFVDLGMLGDPHLVTTAIASMLGLSIQSEDATPNLLAYLCKRRVLLILDTCEHLVDVVASLATDIVGMAPQVHVLATSREPLRVESEHVYRLDALACPPDTPQITAAVIHSFPATRLFVERALASGAHLAFGDAEAPIIAGICRKLDGVALAIELAARRVESYGLQQTAALLDQRLTLLWLGSRTAPPRQKTLQATLDWSFGLLSEVERLVLRRLAVFVGHFTLDAAAEVVTSQSLDRTDVFNAIDSLVTKSIVATRPAGAMMRYRLLDTTRAYVLGIEIDEAEAAELATRHAAYYQRWLEQTGTEWAGLSTGEERIPYFAAINNVRAALEWCFGDGGSPKIGVELAVAAAPIFLAMSLLRECHRWSERAILVLGTRTGGPVEMRLQASRGVSMMFMRGGQEAARQALEKSLAIAEQLGLPLDQVRTLGPLNMFELRAGNFKAAFRHAERCAVAVAGLDDAVARGLAHALSGVSHHLQGNLVRAGGELNAALAGTHGSLGTTTLYLGFESRILARAILARNLWLQGDPEQAAANARLAVDEAIAMDHSLTLTIALIWAISASIWMGQLDSALSYIEILVPRAQSYSLAPHLLVGRGFESAIAIERGDARQGVEGLQTALHALHDAPYELLTVELNMALARGLRAVDRSAEALSLIDRTLGLVETQGNVLFTPELLRMKAEIMAEPAGSEAEACLLQSLQWSRSQGSRAWELRAARDLAALWHRQGRTGEARRLLEPMIKQFPQGSQTTGL